jgi:hypothetical protein
MGHHHESVDHLDRFVTFSVCVPGAGTERMVMLPSPALFLHYISRQAVPDYWTIPGIVSLLNGGANTLNFVLSQPFQPANIFFVLVGRCGAIRIFSYPSPGSVRRGPVLVVPAAALSI